MSNISVTTTQNVIAVTQTGGITVTTPEGQTIAVTVPNSSVNVTNTTDDITITEVGITNTDQLIEGTTNLFFTTARARASLSAGTGISYNTTTGVITNTSINTDTTYTIDASTTSGGANLNLVGSDSTTDSVAYLGSGATSVARTDANTITISSTDTNTTYTQNASSTSGGANLNLVGSDSTTDAVKFAGGTNITVSRTDANTITIDGNDLNTTYTIASGATSGGANLTLTGSDSSTDSVAYLGAGATTVTSTDANTVTITSTDTNTTYTQNASATSGGANLNLVGSDSTTDTIKFANGTNVTVTRTDADTITIAATDTNTTYTVDATATSGGANLNLTGSDSSTDSVAYLGSGATTVTRTDANTITVSSTDTNTTYTQNFSATTGGANLNLVGSDSTTDTVKFANGTGVTVTRTDADTATIAIGQPVATTDNVQFNDITLTGNIIDTGALQISTGSNGNITLAPNGTGDVALTLNNGGNLTNTRNYVMGTVRDSTTDTNGDAWSFLSGTSTGYRGISVDNSTTTTKRPGIIMRSFSASGAAVSPRMAIFTEGSRGTPGSPTAIQANDFIGEWLANGRSTTGWASDLVATSAAAQVYYATEAWTALTNTGTGWALSLQPTATTLTAASKITVIDATPQAINTRSDAYNFKSKANTNLVTVASDGQLQVFNTNATNPNNLYGYATKVFVTTTENALGNNITIKPGKLTGSTSYDKQTELSVIQNTTDGTSRASYEMKTQRFNGTSYSPTQSGDSLGRLLFNGNYASGATPAVNQPGAQVATEATETWTGSAAGTKTVFTITKTGTNTNLAVADFASTATTFKTDSYTFQDSNGTNFVVIDANTAKFNVPVTTEITTTTISEGTTYTPAATVDNNISVQINTLSGGTTVIDLINLTGNSRGGSYNILVFNNTASGTPIQVKNTRINSNNLTTHTITSGDRIIINAFVVGDYATATHLVVA